jgi:hypothetical protein
MSELCEHVISQLDRVQIPTEYTNKMLQFSAKICSFTEMFSHLPKHQPLEWVEPQAIGIQILTYGNLLFYVKLTEEIEVLIRPDTHSKEDCQQLPHPKERQKFEELGACFSSIREFVI